MSTKPINIHEYIKAKKVVEDLPPLILQIENTILSLYDRIQYKGNLQLMTNLQAQKEYLEVQLRLNEERIKRFKK